MILKKFFVLFFTIFIAELGDKTQLATFLFATDKDNPKTLVFLACSLALIVATAIAVLLGDVASKYISTKTLSRIAGAGFILIGIWTLVKA